MRHPNKRPLGDLKPYQEEFIDPNLPTDDELDRVAMVAGFLECNGVPYRRPVLAAVQSTQKDQEAA